MSYRNLLILLASMAFMLALGCTSGETVGETTTKLQAECRQDLEDLEDTDWLCGEGLTVECENGGADPDYIYLVPSGETPASCDDIELDLSHEGPFMGLDDHQVMVEASVDGAFIEDCESTLTIKDELPPVPNEEPIELWPPNHKFHTISGEDCVQDACDDNVTVTFLWASSDEPRNAKGDGNTEPDIILECDRVQLRAERQGGGNGRTYKLGWTAVDESGNQPEEEQVCVVTVPHDQSGKDVEDNDDAYYTVKHQDPSECDDGTGGGGGDDGGGGGGGDDGGGGGGGGDGGGGGVVVVL